MTNSGRAALLIVEAAANSVPVRSATALILAKRIAEKAGIKCDRTVADQRIELISRGLEDKVVIIEEGLNKQSPFSGPRFGDPQPYLKPLREALNNEKERISGDLDVLAIQAEREVGREKTGAATTIGIHGPVGVVQSGNSNVGSVTQHIDQGTIISLSDPLSKIFEIIEVEASDCGELKEIVVEAQAELQKKPPNKTKLRTLVSGIGKTIEILPKFKPAYDTLIWAVQGIGGFFSGS